MTKFEKGMTLPAGTKIKCLSTSSVHNRDFYVGKTMYSTNYIYAGGNSGIPANIEPNNSTSGEVWVTEWELITDEPEALTDAQKTDLAKRALAAAKERGYCDETKKILADLGLPTEFSHNRTVVVEFEIEESDGIVFNEMGNYRTLIGRYNEAMRLGKTGVKIISAKTISDTYHD